MKHYINNIFKIKSDADFEKLSLQAFHYQHKSNPVYRKYCDYLNIDSSKVQSIRDIPFLPVEFFKSQNIITENKKAEVVFTSSGTTGMQTSRHLVADTQLYDRSFMFCFNYFYHSIKNYVILALLPSYLERSGSSLIYMTEKLIAASEQKESAFFLHNTQELYNILQQLEMQKRPVILLGVSFALLDFFEEFEMQLNHTVIMETGGMKGRKKEIIRSELHEFICRRAGVDAVHSEYGMTELLSQAYSKGNSIFRTPPQMRILIRDTNDPFSYLPAGKTGGVNIIDLANIYSCPFIETKDLGKTHPDRQFEILGRFDNSDIRGCNLMVI